MDNINGKIYGLVLMATFMVVGMGLFLFRDDVEGGVGNTVEAVVEVQEIRDTKITDTHLALIQAEYPTMTGYVSNLATNNEKYDYFIETKEGDVNFVKVNRYFFSNPDLTTTEAIEEGTLLYDQYEESISEVGRILESDN